MRTLCTVLIILVVFAQTAISQSTLPNGNLNDWNFESHPTHPDQGFYEPDGGFFKTLNILDTLLFHPGLTCYRTDTVHTGAYAARLITRKIDFLDILIPGIVGTLKINWATINATLGLPYSYPSKPARFQGYYKSSPVNGDSAGAVILLSKWNVANNKRDTIGYKRLVFQGTVTEYTNFDAPIDYFDEVTMPDSITLLLLASAGYNAVQMTASVGQVGSQAWFDDITLTDINGFAHLLMPEIAVNVFPNPASSKLTIELEKIVNNGRLEIYSSDGKLISSTQLANIRNEILISSLHSGVYYYKISQGKSVLNTGTFMVKN